MEAAIQKDSVNPNWPIRGGRSLVIYPNDPVPEGSFVFGG